MPKSSYLLRHAPHWQRNRTGMRQQLPLAVQSWIYETGSLTQRLRRRYGDALAVQVLRQYWHTPLLSERRSLQLAEGRRTLVREVLLHAQQQPLILARTVIPWQTVQYLPYNLTRLGTRPLGEIIFADPKIERSTLELAYIVPALWTTEARLLGQINAAVWGRRTLYLAWQQPLLVTECFLPAVL